MANPYTGETITKLDATGIKVIRARLGDTQEQFADRFDVSIDTVRSWETGRRSPAADIRAKLIYLSRPAAFAAQRASQALRDTARMYDANAIAWEAEGDDEMAESSRKTATKLHEMADNHEAMGKTDPRNDPMGIVGPEARPR